MNDKEHMLKKCKEVIGDPRSSNEALQVANYLLSSLDLEQSLVDTNIQIPLAQSQLDVRVGRDGTWMSFKSKSGRSATICVNSLAENKGGIIWQAIKDWCDDMEVRANKIREGE